MIWGQTGGRIPSQLEKGNTVTEQVILELDSYRRLEVCPVGDGWGGSMGTDADVLILSIQCQSWLEGVWGA